MADWDVIFSTFADCDVIFSAIAEWDFSAKQSTMTSPLYQAYMVTVLCQAYIVLSKAYIVSFMQNIYCFWKLLLTKSFMKYPGTRAEIFRIFSQ